MFLHSSKPIWAVTQYSLYNLELGGNVLILKALGRWLLWSGWLWSVRKSNINSHNMRTLIWSLRMGICALLWNELKLRMSEVANILYLNVLYQFAFNAIQFQFLKPWMFWGQVYLCDPLSSAMLQKSGHFFIVIYNWLSFGSDDENLCKSSHLWK